MKKIIIAGGVAGGASAAARLRRLAEDAQITIYEKGPYVSFANCGLPYHVGKVIPERSSLILTSPQKFKASYNIDVKTSHEVIAIDAQQKYVTVRNEQGQEFKDSFDDLIIATGSTPIKLPIPGADSKKVLPLWTIPDVDTLKKYTKDAKLKRAVIIGAGFIGLEVAENLAHLGFEVHVVEMAEQVMAPFDPEMATLIANAMQDEGLKLHLGAGIKRFDEHDDAIEVTLSDKSSITADLVVSAAGVKPNAKITEGTGIDLGPRGHIIVNDEMATNIPHIHAVGDVTATKSPLTGEITAVPLAGPANKQGRICADNIINPHSAHYHGTLGTSIIKICGLEAASTGLSEKALHHAGKEDFFSVIVRQKDHASYYPGARDLCLKGIFAKENGRLLGAQVIGAHGADKRIDVLSTILAHNGTIDDLCDAECAYAPPFSSAKDPVNMLGFTAQNVLHGLVSFITPKELDAMTPEKRAQTELIDVREEPEFSVYAIPGFKNIPLSTFREHLAQIDSTRPVILTCASGVRSYNATRILMQSGFKDVKSLSGGTGFYRLMHYEGPVITMPQNTNPDNPTSNSDHTGSNGNEACSINSVSANSGSEHAIEILDCTGLSCPGPIMKLRDYAASIPSGTRFKVKADDPGFAADVKSWAARNNSEITGFARQDGCFEVTIETKGKGNTGATGTNPANAEVASIATNQGNLANSPRGKTIVVFDDDLDRVLAALVIANGAAAMNSPVTLFFTFWGLNAIKKKGAKSLVHKSLVHRMFGVMMPKSIASLRLSKFNFLGLGRHMMLGLMHKKNIADPEALLESARKNGVRFVACSMSMDVMGVSADELIDGVEIGGVASYLGYAQDADTNLFI